MTFDLSKIQNDKNLQKKSNQLQVQLVVTPMSVFGIYISMNANCLHMLAYMLAIFIGPGETNCSQEFLINLPFNSNSVNLISYLI